MPVIGSCLCFNLLVGLFTVLQHLHMSIVSSYTNITQVSLHCIRVKLLCSWCVNYGPNKAHMFKPPSYMARTFDIHPDKVLH